jgi:hypothetical protein
MLVTAGSILTKKKVVYQRELVTSVVSGEGFDDELEHSFWIGKK